MIHCRSGVELSVGMVRWRCLPYIEHLKQSPRGPVRKCAPTTYLRITHAALRSSVALVSPPPHAANLLALLFLCPCISPAALAGSATTLFLIPPHSLILFRHSSPYPPAPLVLGLCLYRVQNFKLTCDAL